MSLDVGSPLDAEEVARLIARARNGESAALEQLLTHYAPRIAELVHQHVSGAQVGQQRRSDIHQESSLRAFQRFQSFSGSTAPELDTWLRRIVTTRIAQAARHSKRLKRNDGKTVPIESVQPPSEQASPSQNVAAAEEWRRVLALLFELPEPQREAIWLHHLREMPVSEVARSKAWTDGQVAGYIGRGLKTLNKWFPKQEEPLGNDDALDERVTDALLAYLRSREQKHPTSQEEFLARHADCAPQLRIMLEWIERIEAQRATSTKPTRRGARK